MKKYSVTISILLILLAIYGGFILSMPGYSPDTDLDEDLFATDRALAHVKKMSQKPHAVGFPAHTEVRNYIILELEKLGLETFVQDGYTAGDWGNLSKATNILARIKGTRPGKALLLLSHYDSSPHSSFGASDAASGVATVLEGVRAFLKQDNAPKNDVIILFSDAEELGLNGADLFVNKHPWAKDVGLSLNFEARGSGGPSYMLLETNRGNSTLIQEFIKANTAYPVANSLVYSVYKMLPNDTDLTVFREDMDIDGFNFAFIDDHFDYHTAKDIYDRLDQNTQAHQGSYLMPLLEHFSQIDLGRLKSPNDSVYFSVPFFKMVSYPFEWIFPMLIIAILLLIILGIYGLKKRVLDIKEMGLGFVPLLMTLTINGVVGFYSWRTLLWAYPQYADMLHGFTYNGYAYIAAFVLFSVSVAFWSYHRFNKLRTPNLLIAPLIFWLIICSLLAVYLKGGSFFIIPVYALLASLWILIDQKSASPYLFVVLALPAIWLFTPLIKMFPVGLGLKMMVTATILTSLTFFLVLPVFNALKNKNRMAYLCFILFIGFIASAHFNSGFSKDRARPTSLVYLLDADKQTAQWATYDKVLSPWTSQYLGDEKELPQEREQQTFSSKYGTGFSYVSQAPLRDIAPPVITIAQDTIVGDLRLLEINIESQRPIQRLEVFLNDIAIKKAIVNGIPLSDHYLQNRKSNKLITHFVSDNDPTRLQISFPKDRNPELTLYESSNDLLNHPQFTVPQRPEDQIPMPFVL
ncbi:MAG TPA: M28 family peptidase, partial [Arenibacter sp.]|nr:M28 family peptidase [Arenibacter sp.]